ncbi:hypothetical protein [Methylomicrobium sp. Wu6]|uniref:hypothetical protein n=1 Tax=Methylomicrobium sp. Wu6 TaxID=3107928 RepID=UPI002DD65F86|nr:hypothetical protein [Methylomicrobium sp. Wu6]MEC4747534.1 hypothetical protein [Methylomicrobium sp. Wu6]
MNPDDENLNNSSAEKKPFFTPAEKQRLEQSLLANLKAHHAELASLLASIRDHAYEDTVYRFYSGSARLYQHAPQRTGEIVKALRRLAPPGTTICTLFEEICQVGGHEKPFALEYNSNWGLHGRPFVEAFFHAHYFLEMAVKYGKTLDEPPAYLPSGWAALLCLYDIR